MVEDIQGTPAVTDVAELSQRMTDFVTTVRQDTYEIYGRLDDAQDDRLLMSGESTEDYNASSVDRDCSFASSRPRSTSTACGETETDEYTTNIGTIFSCDLKKMAPKRTTRSTPATTTTLTTSVTDEQLMRLID
ncbi:hypothetical protein Tco_1428465 [Tanacetum coccineum]